MLEWIVARLNQVLQCCLYPSSEIYYWVTKRQTQGREAVYANPMTLTFQVSCSDYLSLILLTNLADQVVLTSSVLDVPGTRDLFFLSETMISKLARWPFPSVMPRGTVYIPSLVISAWSWISFESKAISFCLATASAMALAETPFVSWDPSLTWRLIACTAVTTDQMLQRNLLSW